MLDESDLFFEFVAPPGLFQPPANHGVHPTEERVSPDTDTDVEDEGYTLTAFGDISLSNVLFVPGLPTAISPERRTRKEPRMSHSRDNQTPVVIRKVLPPSSSKPALLSLKSDSDFETLVENLKKSHRTSSSSPRKAKQSGHDQHLCIHAPQPRHLINLNLVGGDAANEFRESRRVAQISTKTTEEKTRVVETQDHKTEVVAPKPKERPLRGNAKLPSRPPIPRWDLLDPEYAVETPVVHRGVGSRLKM